MSTQDILTQYISHELLAVNNDSALQADDNLLTSGLIDSLGVMRLVGFIEDEFDVEVLPEDITIENFRTINLIAAYLNKRQD